MKILITGSLGLVGSTAMTFFKEKGWVVYGIDTNERAKMFRTPEKESDMLTEPIDIRDAATIEALFVQEGPFDAIIHAAGQPSHDYSATHVMEDFLINAAGTLILLEATRKHSPQATFVYVSSDKVYGENLREPLTHETDGLDMAGKRSPFGCSKAAADMYVQEYGNYFGMHTVCFRPGCITGKNHEGAELHGFLAYVAKCVKTDTPYTIFANTVRDQIHAYDLVNAFWHFIQHPKVGAVYNIGGGTERALSVQEAIASCEKRIGNTIQVTEGEMRPGDRMYDVHDVSKFRRDYPAWDYTYSLSAILDELCEK